MKRFSALLLVFASTAVLLVLGCETANQEPAPPETSPPTVTPHPKAILVPSGTDIGNWVVFRSETEGGELVGVGSQGIINNQI